ncbi:hypothetical protein FKP32DRAFT_985257 [Trametes sanguinea]|nr:hypothetical protein FKP32DRAFT_985257 [Trametes sanguinea]
MPSYLERLDKIGELIRGFRAHRQHQAFVDLLKGVTSIVREAEHAGAPELPEVVDKAGDILEMGTKWAYTDGDFDFLPSFAHSLEEPIVKDSLSLETRQTRQVLESFVSNFESFFLGRPSREPIRLPDTKMSKPWPQTPHPHPKASRLSRFREGVNVSATEATSVAQMIYQARCEVAADCIPCPVDAAISADSSTLAVIEQGGWKNREPIFTIYILDDAEGGTGKAKENKEDVEVDDYYGFRRMGIETGLSEVARELAMDAQHRLAFVADSHRIKSFSWGGDVTFDGWRPGRGRNVHTMKSAGYDGPLAVLPGGRIARAGKGGAAIWDLETLQTHKGKKRVGPGEFDASNSWRDDDGDIELSTGSEPSVTVAFAQRDLVPVSWHLHEPTGLMLCGESGHKTQKFGCYGVDLEHGGKKAMRFLGHGGDVNAFSTSAGDPNVFMTACGDGFARLFDVRHPLPVVTIDAGRSSEFLRTVQLVHPDGIPTVFTGSIRHQNIKLWDLRARSAVYELATGNTAVTALAWDAKRTTLYAATECDYMDRLGYTHGYRPAHIPGWAKQDPVDEMDTEGADGDEEDDDDYDGEHCWPENAPHDERYFGYAYDAGEHLLLRYQYKDDPDPTVLPDYGQAQIGGGGFW